MLVLHYILLSPQLRRKLFNILVERQFLSDYNLGYVQNLSIDELVNYQFVSAHVLYGILSEILNFQFISPNQTWEYIYHEQGVLIAKKDNIYWLLTKDPFDVVILDKLRREFTINQIGISTPSCIQKFIHKANAVSTNDLLTKILEEAIKKSASDIHFLHDDMFVRLSFRIYGVIKQHSIIAKEKWRALINQIKIRALLDITETRRAQNGQINGTFAGHEINCRIAIHPTLGEETVTIRILYQHHKVGSLKELGFPEPFSKILNEIIDTPSGLFLITGPTGSGKTTTLYSLFQPHIYNKKIMTLEDPVEYILPPIQQTEIRHPEIFSYQDGLKSILRHDPDIIFVGEIRDKETAELSLRAAMTGHLVCATTHTHCALDALYRFLDFGISQTALGTQLLGILAQKLYSDHNCFRLQAELLLCDTKIKQHLVSNGALHDLPPLLNKTNHFAHY